MSLIEREKLIDHLNACIAESDGKTPITDAVLVAIRCAVEQMPEVDAVPVVHGEWEVVAWVEPDYHSYGTIKKPNAAIRCKQCSHAFKKELLFEANYCPNCGARMDGGKE